MASEILRATATADYTPGEPVTNVTYGAFPSVAQASIEPWAVQCEAGKASHLNSNGWHWQGANMTQNVFNTVAPPNYKLPTCIAVNPPGMASDRDGMYPARSRHPGGSIRPWRTGRCSSCMSDITGIFIRGSGHATAKRRSKSPSRMSARHVTTPIL